MSIDVKITLVPPTGLRVVTVAPAAGVASVCGLTGVVASPALTAAQLAGLSAGVLTGVASTILFPSTNAGAAGSVSLAQLQAAIGGGATITGIDGGVVGVSPPPPPPPPPGGSPSMDFSIAANSQYAGLIL